MLPHLEAASALSAATRVTFLFMSSKGVVKIIMEIDDFIDCDHAHSATYLRITSGLLLHRNTYFKVLGYYLQATSPQEYNSILFQT